MGETLLALYDWAVCAAIFAVGWFCGREASREARLDPPSGTDPPIYMEHEHGDDADVHRHQ